MKIIKKLIRKLKNLNRKQRKIIYTLWILLGLGLFGRLHLFYMLSTIAFQIIIILLYENRLLLKEINRTVLWKEMREGNQKCIKK